MVDMNMMTKHKLYQVQLIWKGIQIESDESRPQNIFQGCPWKSFRTFLLKKLINSNFSNLIL